MAADARNNHGPTALSRASRIAAAAVLGVGGLGLLAWSMNSHAPRDVALTLRSPGTASSADGGGGAPALVRVETARNPNAPLGKVNVNTATQAQLELLPGIGPALAKRIIDYRTEHGVFKSVDDLDKVKGIGPKLIARMEGLVVFE